MVMPLQSKEETDAVLLNPKPYYWRQLRESSQKLLQNDTIAFDFMSFSSLSPNPHLSSFFFSPREITVDTVPPWT